MVTVTQISIGPQCVTDFPGASDMVAEVLTVGVEVEAALAVVLASLSGSEPHVAAIVLHQMRSVVDQQKAVLEVAKAQLDASRFTILDAAFRAIDAHRLRRNRFAHRTWASSPELPDAIFQLKTSEHSRRLIGVLAGPRIPNLDGLQYRIEETDIYRAADLQAARVEAREALSVMYLLMQYMLTSRVPAPLNGEEHSAQLLAMLRRVSSFAEAERRLLARRDQPRD